ncbi:EAL domain-containing protein [Vibrio brasiliensis]|uniref:EAL domain-containing protein n=1 Tax=Vibrio brasiliensis TaxID=170652 RepID=UPI001EFE383C|nr:EAL domain-containing protein [Vibrio brasiliensis]MCG9648069.1 EAL domain-containing protein [Vibrio brasiliensis]
MNTSLIYRVFSRFSENTYLNGLCNVFVMLLPVSLLSAFATLIGNGLMIWGFESEANYLLFVSRLVWKLFPMLLLIYYALFLARLHNISRTNVVTPSVLVYVILCNEWGLLHPGSILPASYPLAIVTPLLVACAVKHMMRRRVFLDSALPNVVDQSINLILGTIALVSAFVFIGHLIGKLVLALPVLDWVPSIGVDSLLGGLWYELIRSLLWTIGINGHVVLASYKNELYEVSVNCFNSYKAVGGDLPILTSSFYDIYAGIGGAGNTLSLVLCMLLFTKNKGYRTLAGATLILSLFNINEPVLFGLPVIFNPVLIIPFLLTPLVAIVVAYTATLLGMVAPVSEFVSWMTPSLISGYIATDGHISGSILQLVIIAIGIAIYLPFFKQMDRVSGSHAVFTKGSSDEFFNYEEIGNNRSVIGLLPNMSGNLLAQTDISNLQRSGEFVLFYQPQVNNDKNCVSSLEVLIRHRSKDGTITPPTFLSSFAKLGLTSDLDMWVIKRALKEVAPLAPNATFKISINVSPETFLVPNFAEIVIDLIENSALSFEQVELEITEELLIQDEQTTWSVFTQLREKGIQIALDDFGSGYSSIGHLCKYEFDKVKIDRSLVVNLKHKHGREMFRLTSELVRITGAEIVVEGVETDEELDFVSQQGITLIQGYYFYKPMPFDQVCQQVVFCNS